MSHVVERFRLDACLKSQEASIAISGGFLDRSNTFLVVLRNNKLLGTSASLLGARALLVVARSERRNNKLQIKLIASCYY